jgi:glycosyltransferase involved in cell wall biosynthesis
VSSVAITVLFTTANREDVLSRALEGYCRLEAPLHGWKLVVVDNGSKDSTPDILASFKKRLPLEILRQPNAGQNRARNFGLSALEGHLAIFTDDDAIPDPSFLAAWSKYLNKHEDYEILGGSIDPLFEVPPPKWILKNKAQFDMLFAVRDLPEGPLAPDAVFGPNMAIRSPIFERGFRFNENIGPNASDPLYPMGAETEFCCRLARSGAKAWFAREPRVQHIIRAHQLSRSYWAMRAYRHGRGVARREWESGQAAPPSRSRPLVVDLLANLCRWFKMFSPFPLQRFNSVSAYHWRRGFLDEWAKKRVITSKEAILARARIE